MQSRNRPPDIVFRLNLRNLPQATQRGAHGRGGRSGNDVGTAGNSLPAGVAVPDTGGVTLDGRLAAEGAGVLGVLGDFHLLHLLTQGGTVPGTVLSGHADLLWWGSACGLKGLPSVVIRCSSPFQVFKCRIESAPVSREPSVGEIFTTIVFTTVDSKVG